MKHKATSLRVNRLHATSKIAPLLSWRLLRELPWVFRIPLMVIGSALLVSGCEKESPKATSAPSIPTPPTVVQPDFIARDTAAPEPAEIYTSLRNAILALKPTDLTPPVQDNAPYVFMMETGYDQAIVTLICVTDGTTSLYFSNGGGQIGCGEHAPVRQANIELFKRLPESIAYFSPVNQTPGPKVGQTIFYLVTSDGVLGTASLSEDDLGNKRSPLSPLFFLVQDVLTQIRLLPQQ